MIKLIKISLIFFIFIALLSYCYAGYEDDLVTEANETHDDISELNEDIIEIYEDEENTESDEQNYYYNENTHTSNELDLVEQIKNLDFSSVVEYLGVTNTDSIIEYRELVKNGVQGAFSWRTCLR